MRGSLEGRPAGRPYALCQDISDTLFLLSLTDFSANS
jgi:hypothetical protein